MTDFEAASIAPPELDVGWWLMFDRTMHEGAGVDASRGRPDRATSSCACTRRRRGASVPDARWFEICAAARYCAIVVRVMNRAVDRGLMPEDHTHLAREPGGHRAGGAARGDLTGRRRGQLLARIRLCTSG